MNSASVYQLVRPSKRRTPLVISLPHAGTLIPESLREHFSPTVLEELRDTDWYVDQLYDCASELGATLITARYSRYVVDLNRAPDGALLYQDQRRQTEVIALTDFDGQDLYRPGCQPTKEDRTLRLKTYYEPYHEILQAELKALRLEFSNVLLFDGHSIRRHVPSLSPLPFADLIVGDRDGVSAAQELTQALVETLRSSPYSFQLNHPFKGGYITRNYGQPSAGVHAIQLEMSQDIYLDPSRRSLDQAKSSRLKAVLRASMEALLRTLEEI